MQQFLKGFPKDNACADRDGENNQYTGYIFRPGKSVCIAACRNPPGQVESDKERYRIESVTDVVNRIGQQSDAAGQTHNYNLEDGCDRQRSQCQPDSANPAVILQECCVRGHRCALVAMAVQVKNGADPAPQPLVVVMGMGMIVCVVVSVVVRMVMGGVVRMRVRVWVWVTGS